MTQEECLAPFPFPFSWQDTLIHRGQPGEEGSVWQAVDTADHPTDVAAKRSFLTSGVTG